MPPKRKNFRSKPKPKAKFDPAVRNPKPQATKKKIFRRKSKRIQKFSAANQKIQNEIADESNFETIAKICDISNDVKPFFLEMVPFEEHFKAQETNRFRYLAAMMALEKNKVEILQGKN